jgi:hypothetical protein
MSDENQCPRCLKKFSSRQRLDSHLKRKILCEKSHEKPKSFCIRNEDLKKEKFICQHCKRFFANRDTLSVHLKKIRCVVLKANLLNQTGSPEKDRINELRAEFRAELQAEAELRVKLKAEFEKQIDELKDKPNITNQILQVVCISGNDNYLDMLTQEWNFDRALGFIKDCALSNLSGDCKLIEKIYLSNEQSSISYIDKNRTKIVYFNENKEKIVDPRGKLLAKKLANNLQNSYLKGINYLINKNLDNRSCPNKFLEEYDIQTWNRHIYELSDSRYQRKIINQLEIPILGG